MGQHLDAQNSSSLTNNLTQSQPWVPLEGLEGLIGGGCGHWREPQQLLFHLANGCFLTSYVSPHTRHGALFMHSVLILGFLLFSIWAWSIVCAPDVFSWNFGLAILNVAQLLHTAYQMRPVSFDPELEEAYRTLFLPFKKKWFRIGVWRIGIERRVGELQKEKAKTELRQVQRPLNIRLILKTNDHFIRLETLKSKTVIFQK